MAGIDESRTFKPLNLAVMTVSDTRTESTDFRRTAFIIFGIAIALY